MKRIILVCNAILSVVVLCLCFDAHAFVKILSAIYMALSCSVLGYSLRKSTEGREQRCVVFSYYLIGTLLLAIAAFFVLEALHIRPLARYLTIGIIFIVGGIMACFALAKKKE